MLRIITLGCVVVAVLGSAYLLAGGEPAVHDGSPAFRAHLENAIARLEGVTREVASTAVGEAEAKGPAQETVYPAPTCDRDVGECYELTLHGGNTCEGEPTCTSGYTCSRYYTCDSQSTCHSDYTCNGWWTCWWSTCEEFEATCDGLGWTCFGGIECPGPYTWQGHFTCDQSATCNHTCQGWPDCPAAFTLKPSEFTCNVEVCTDQTLDSRLTCDAAMITCAADATCKRYYTCDSRYTCSGELNCDGSETAWSSTCNAPGATCDGSPECTGEPWTYMGSYTCNAEPTCEATCAGWPNCLTDVQDDGGSGRTTWGKMKKEFGE